MEERTRQSRPTTAADLHRLAALAHTRGLRLTQESESAWFASSVSTDEPHYVTGLSCDCRGFMEHQRCTHYAALLDHLDWLPELEDEASVTVPAVLTVPCGNCAGGGVVYVPDCARAGWPHPVCPECQGSGIAAGPVALTEARSPAAVAA